MTSAQLTGLIHRKQSFLCVGLDTDPQKIPSFLFDFNDPVFEFNKRIIDATREFAVAFKPNLAFYESMGSKGWDSLKKTLDYIPSGFFTIADAKRGDIGNTAEKYAATFFRELNFDAVTLSPYLGRDAIEPFLEYKDKWCIILAKTSNSSAADFQDTMTGNGDPLYLNVVKKAMTWGSIDQIMFVVGAQNSDALKAIREVAPDHFLLIPGFGAQGGQLKDIRPFLSINSVGILANYSRQIIYAGNDENFALSVKAEAARIAGTMTEMLAEKSNSGI